MKNFLDIKSHDTATLREILLNGSRIKANLKSGKTTDVLTGKTLVMIFEKPSTRTRVSFQVGMQ